VTGLDPHAEAMRAYYGRGEEHARLEQGHGLLEFVRTIEILSRHLPDPPARLADVGGGPGRYALWLAEHGYEVEHRDLIELHVEQLRGSLTDEHRVSTAVGDARALNLPDESVEAVLLLGPLYHLARRQDRLTALRSARRVVRPGAVLDSARALERVPEVIGASPHLLAVATRDDARPAGQP
jgi:ubiquinone/menaquinone biosynthesis C-methylase UbiE